MKDFSLRQRRRQRRDVIASRPLTVAPVSATLEAPGQIAAGSTIVVHWKGPGNERDSIVLAPPESDAGTYSSYAYVKAESDTVELRAPDVQGVYVLRYIISKDRQVIAERQITVN